MLISYKKEDVVYFPMRQPFTRDQMTQKFSHFVYQDTLRAYNTVLILYFKFDENLHADYILPD